MRSWSWVRIPPIPELYSPSIRIGGATILKNESRALQLGVRHICYELFGLKRLSFKLSQVYTGSLYELILTISIVEMNSMFRLLVGFS